ncbi:hypothetical protein EHQ12_06550 [Leptospira gomenensis]|uniref:IPT/TIG domain-containing protein n=1 Tax=Leptospira gomenensis TaxID=2484974 RepID=A0A5F1Y6H3_9LEPT|nr:IPT/TIG domain-containing protein [Leptospira gomenensis]TGK28803.1 hypothetical protein EHQ17_17220 [Leptospira gomenensis]TGK40991.1 hypothetical protein EHQ12_06550 [Leptospira gomenensis]TGK46157.1 hypothetical protein EHQ07_06850 [Leptospira gomenensis]TGK67260.1 hypothetical protein EHQ13_02770 [Leptospira gomenensis]
MKKWMTLFHIVIFLSLSSNCKKSGSDDETLTLFFLLTSLNSETIADIYPELGIPGSTTTVSGTDFTGVAADYTVTIDGTAATGIALVDSNTLTFTMPTLADVSENKTVPIVVNRSGSNVLSKTIRYRPAVPIALNQPNSLTGTVSSTDVSVFYTFTVANNTDHVFNVFGYNGADLNLYYYTSPVSTPTILAAGTATNAEFDKANLTVGTYILQVKLISGGPLATNFKTNLSDGAIVPALTSNFVDTQRLCYDILGSSSIANIAAGCETVNPPADPNMTRTGRCTYPSENGLTTRSYYRDTVGFGFSTPYAEATCTQPGLGSYNTDQAIFVPN